MMLVNNLFTSDLKTAFPEDRFMLKKTGGFYLLYHTLDARNMTFGEYNELRLILDSHAAVTENTTMIFDEELVTEKFRRSWKDDEEIERD